MHFVYYSHSYRSADKEINKNFERILISEGITISIDPPSDSKNLNSAKPERHLRSTDGMVCVLPDRKEGPSEFILYEITLAMRTRRPLVVFVEDTLPSNIIPVTLLARRFSRRSLLRQARDIRHVLGIFKNYIGDNPPPNYQPSLTQRSCLIIGDSCLKPEIRQRVDDKIRSLRYLPVFAPIGNKFLTAAPAPDEAISQASFAVAFTEDLNPQEYYCLGAVRAASTPTITLTQNSNYPYDPRIPKEYQPRFVEIDSAQSICETLGREVEIFEQDYLDIKDQEQAERYEFYKSVVLKGASEKGVYTSDTRTAIIEKVVMNIYDNHGNINIDSHLENVTQVVNASANLQPEKRQELAELVQELKTALNSVSQTRPEDASRLVKMVELAVQEGTRAKPDQGFFKITAEGLKQAAKALQDIAPAVLTVTQKIVEFLIRLGI